MDLQEEYFGRRKLFGRAKLIRYAEKSGVIMRLKDGKQNSDQAWLNVSLEKKQEPNHPPYYMLTVTSNPVIYASSDYNHFSLQHAKILQEQRWEWDSYEANLLEWCLGHSRNYQAVLCNDAQMVCWEMFLQSYDTWFANFASSRVIDMLHASITGPDRTHNIAAVESWLKEKYDRVFNCWRSVRNMIDSRTYADWLANLINN